MRLGLLPRLDALTARNVRWDTLYSVFSALYLIVPASFAGVIARHLGAEPLHLGIFFGLGYIGTFIAPFSGLWMPKGRLVAYAASVDAFFRVLLALAAVVVQPLLFLVIVAASTVSNHLAGPIRTDIARRIYPLAQRGQLVAFVRMAAVTSTLAAASLYGLILDRFGPVVLLPLAALLGVVGSLWYSRIRVPPVEVESQMRFSPREVYRDLWVEPRESQWVIAQWFWAIAIGAVWPQFSILLVDRFHASYTQVGLLATITSVAGVASYVFWGRLTDSQSPFVVSGLAMAGMGMVPLGYLLSPSVDWLVLVAIVSGISIAGVEVASFNAFSRIPPKGMLARHAIAINSILGPWLMISGIVGGLLYAAPWFGPSPLLVLAVLFCITCGVLTARIPVKPAELPRAAPHLPPAEPELG